jgi:hypothetical protein
MTLSQWVNKSRRFNAIWCNHLQASYGQKRGFGNISFCLESSAARYIVMQLHILEQGSQILGSWSPGQVHFVPWHLIFLIPRCGACFISPFWGVQMCGGAQIFGYLCTPVPEERDLELSNSSNRLILWKDPLPEDTSLYCCHRVSTQLQLNL